MERKIVEYIEAIYRIVKMMLLKKGNISEGKTFGFHRKL